MHPPILQKHAAFEVTFGLTGPRHPKAASEEEKKAFKEEAEQLATCHSGEGYTILSGDEASHILGWNLQRGWYHKDEPAVAPMTLSRKRSTP